MPIKRSRQKKGATTHLKNHLRLGSFLKTFQFGINKFSVAEFDGNEHTDGGFFENHAD